FLAFAPLVALGASLVALRAFLSLLRLAALLGELAALLPALVELLVHALVQSVEAALVARRPEELGHAVEHARAQRAAHGCEAGLVRAHADYALRGADLGLSDVHAVVGAGLAAAASFRYHQRLVLGAADADRRRGRAHDRALGSQLRDPAGDRPERAVEEPDDRAVVAAAFRAEIHDAHAGAGAHRDVAAVLHPQVHFAVGASRDAVALVA